MTIALAAVALLPLVAVLAVAAARRPLRVLLPVYAGVVPFGSGVTVPIGVPPPFNTVSTLIGLAALVALTAHLVLSPRSSRRLHGSIPMWLLFVGLSAASFVWSVDPAATFDRFLILVSLASLYLVAVLAPVTPRDVARLTDGMVAGGFLASLYGFYLLLTGKLPEEAAGLPRFATAGGVGDASDPNITAAVLVVPFVLALSRALRVGSAPMRAMSSLAAAVMALGILLTASRGGMVAAAAAVVALVAVDPRRGRIAFLSGAVAIMTLLAGAALAPEQFDRLGQPGSSGRTNIWSVGVIACQEHCITGSGLNTFPEVHRRILLEDPAAPGFRLGEPPHNMWLGVAVELGVVGLLLVLAAVMATFAELRRVPTLHRGPPVAVLVGVLASNVFLANLYFKYFWLALMYAAFVALAYAPRPSTRAADTTRLAVAS